MVDAYDAMTTDRPYRRSLGMARAIDELHRDVARGAMSCTLVDAFVALVSHEGTGEGSSVDLPA